MSVVFLFSNPNLLNNIYGCTLSEENEEHNLNRKLSIIRPNNQPLKNTNIISNKSIIKLII